jgi:hypothetical protein
MNAIPSTCPWSSLSVPGMNCANANSAIRVAKLQVPAVPDLRWRSDRAVGRYLMLLRQQQQSALTARDGQTRLATRRFPR